VATFKTAGHTLGLPVGGGPPNRCGVQVRNVRSVAALHAEQVGFGQDRPFQGVCDSPGPLGPGLRVAIPP
jgi:hypothetical protein